MHQSGSLLHCTAGDAPHETLQASFNLFKHQHASHLAPRMPILKLVLATCPSDKPCTHSGYCVRLLSKQLCSAALDNHPLFKVAWLLSIRDGPDLSSAVVPSLY